MRFLRIAASTCGILLALVAGAAVLLDTAAGKRFLLARLASALASGNVSIETRGIEGSIWGRLNVETIAFADATGRFATIDGLVLDWQPSRLFAGELAIEVLAAERVLLNRLPPAAGTDDPAADDAALLPEPPLDIRIGRFGIDTLQLGAALAGAPATLAVGGNAAISSPALLRFHLDAQRLDGVTSTAALDIEFDAAANRLLLDGRLAEPEGGLIAQVLGLERAPPLAARLAGDGPLDDWQGHVAIDGGPDFNATLDMAIAGARPWRIALSGEAALGALLPDEWRFLASPAMQLEAVVALDDDGTAIVERAAATSDAIFAELTGSIAAGQDLALELALETRDVAAWQSVVTPASFAAARIEADIGGTFAAPAIETTIRIDEPSFEGERAAALGLHGTVDVEPERIDFDLTGRLFDFIPSDAAIAASASGEPILRAAGSWDRVGGGIALDRALLDIGTVRLTADGSIDLDPLVASFALDGDLRDLAALAPLTGLDLAGRAALQGHVTADASGLDGIVTLDGQALSFGAPMLDGLLGSNVTLAATLAMAPDGPDKGVLRISDLALDAPGLALEGSAALDLDRSTIDASYRLRLPRLALVDPSLAGALEASGTIVGAFDDPAIAATADMTGLALDGTPLGRYRIEAAIGHPLTALQARIAATGSSPAGPLDLWLTATPRDNGIEFAPLRLAIGNHTRLDGSTLWHSDRAIAEGGLDLRIDTLVPYGALVDAALAGALEGRIELSGAAGGQRIAVDGSLAAPSYGDALADRGTFDATVTLGTGAPAVNLAAEASAIVAGPVALDTLMLAADGTLDALAGTLAATGDYEGPLDLAASFDMAREGATTRFTVATFDGTVAGEPATLEQPAALTVADGTFALDDLALVLGPARVTGRLAQENGALAASLDIAGLPVAWLGAAGNIDDAVGTIDATLHMAGTLEAPTIELNATVDGLAARAPRYRDESTMSATIGAQYGAGRLEVTSVWQGLGNDKLAIELSLPLQFQLEPFVGKVPPTGALSGFARWKGDARFLVAAVPIDPHRLAGPLALDLTLGGTVQAPEVNGSLALDGGEYENFVTGTLLKDLDIALTASGRDDLSFALTATDGNKGTVSADGTMALDPQRGIPFDVSATFSEAILVRRDEAKARASGDVHLAGTTEGATLTGDIVVNRLDGRLDAGLPPHVTKLDVIEINGAEGTVETAPEEEIVPFALDLDVGVSIPNRAYLRGRGLDSEWQGNLRIAGNANAPRIVGDLTPRRGTFTFADRVFDIANSEIVFDGAPDADPLLDISASSNAGSLTAIVRVTGRASDPTIAITSRPPLPQDEVLARLLFGRKGGELSPVQAFQLAQVLTSLTGRGPSTGILDVARQTLGVDMLTVTGGDDDGAGPGVQIGEYLTEDVRVGVEQGFGTGTTAGTVEIELTDELSVESRVQSQGSRVGITWGHDY